MAIKMTGHDLLKRILLVAPVPPPYGGVALQAVLLQKKLREDGINVELLGSNPALSGPFRLLDRIPALRTSFRTVRFCTDFWKAARSAHVVHVLTCSWLYFFVAVSPAVFIGRLRRKRVVLNYHGGQADSFLRSFGWLVRPVFQMANETTAPSRFLAQVIHRRLGVPVSIVPNIVDFSRFRYRTRRPLQPKMLVTRHLEELYDVESVLRAFRRVQQDYPMASLFIAGTGSQEPHLRDLVQSWNLENVHFLGHIPHDHVPELYDQCDILLNASRIDNFPASLIEASAAGLAVVSTNAGGIPFIYRDGENAILVAVGDWQSLASGVLKLLQNQDVAKDLVCSGFELSRQCDWAHVRVPLFAAYALTMTTPALSRQSHETATVFTSALEN